MPLISEHVGALVVCIYALGSNVFAQLVPLLIKYSNVSFTPALYFRIRVAGIAHIGPVWVR
jgi:hypothetical protein